ncbi:methyl-accepting chemotaxis protein [Pleurocapsa sp. PCC 7319]|uniref:methyl-accepting chemotaxis protein n=1 Tax=Pleurocapsa sp. PCC 7319 TaxID=118161 RepID=UPI00034C0035|nr:methyl-accepting chemotaxis protein [Pleurocapsa sp. PCC 7319]
MITEKESQNFPLAANSSNKSEADKNIKGTGTLRRRLLISILPAVLLPLMIASAIGYTITERRAKTEVIDNLEANTLLASKTITTFIRDSLKLTDLVAVNPIVIQAMKEGNKISQSQQLAQQQIDVLEKKFAATKLLAPDENLNNYLQQIVISGQVAEIFFTERNGLNVAFSNPTSDFVQRDEGWWQNSQKEGRDIDEPEFDDSANAIVIAFSRAVKDPQTGEFLGVIKAGVPATTSISDLITFLQGKQNRSAQFQIVDPNNSFVFSNIDFTDVAASDRSGAETDVRGEAENKGQKAMKTEGVEVVGGQPILEVAKTMMQVMGNTLSVEEAQQSIAQISDMSDISLRQEFNNDSEASIVATLRYQDQIYGLSTVPNTNLVSIGVIDYDVVASAGRNLLSVFGLTGIILGTFALGLIIFLAQQLSRPLTNLSQKTQQVAEGNLDVTANIEGTLETRTLADNFNKLIYQVKELLQQQTSVADKQRQEKEKLEEAIYTLIDEVSDATEGDLTVRANLDSLELSTVADLFNAIIDNLQEIAVEAKQSTSKVGSSLKQNEAAIRFLSEQAVSEAQETRKTLTSVEQMSQSIQAVAEKANQVEKIADDTYSTVLKSTDNMDLTVDSILELRSAVGETAKKMKRLGESSQKIAQAVSFIEEIALKTNVLAINTSAEAERAGEYGQGFTIIAEQVGALAEQSAAATKEIENIVATIQAETKEVSQAMESGNSQVVKTTHLVQSTKQSLGQVLEKSQEINQLMGSISQTTVSQATTSQSVTNLMQKIAQLSENTSKSSKEVAQSIVETAQVAQKLESAVAQFKVTN